MLRSMSSQPDLSSTRSCLNAALELSRVCRGGLAAATDHGKRIDDHQVTTERVVYAATELKAAELLLDRAQKTAADKSPMLGHIAAAACSELIDSATRELGATVEELRSHGDVEAALTKTDTAEFRKALRVDGSEARYREIGRWAAEDPRRNPIPVDEMNDQIRQSVREFADREVAPRAEHIHVNDELVPEEFISQIGELGYFGLSIPEQYGGNEMGNLPMIITTEELSRASLAAAGSLITRPEILAKALLSGGTEEQKEQWLPKLASGEVMVGISVTEPDIGSNVAGLKCRAERAESAAKRAGCYEERRRGARLPGAPISWRFWLGRTPT